MESSPAWDFSLVRALLVTIQGDRPVAKPWHTKNAPAELGAKNGPIIQGRKMRNAFLAGKPGVQSKHGMDKRGAGLAADSDEIR